MKYLGIDYGTKRVGIATSDDGGTMAFPLRVIPNTKTLLEDIVDICATERIGGIVLGESRDLAGNPNPIQLAISALAYELRQKNADIPVVFMNEVYSSREATHLQGDNEQNDASAAAIVLQSYLDKINPPRETSHEEV